MNKIDLGMHSTELFGGTISFFSCLIILTDSKKCHYLYAT